VARVNADVHSFMEELDLHHANLRMAVDLGDWHSAGHNVHLLIDRAMHLYDLLTAVNRIERDRDERAIQAEREQGG
jgi:hypothetical protein